MRMRTVVLSAMLVALFMSWTVPSYGQQGGVVNACYGKITGVVRIVGSGKCLPTENPISWNIAGSPGPAGPPGPPGPAGAGAVKLFSANNEFVGMVISWDTIYVPSLGKLMQFDSMSGFNSNFINTYFKSDDCTGTPYTSGEQTTIFIFSEYRNPDFTQFSHYTVSPVLETAIFSSFRHYINGCQLTNYSGLRQKQALTEVHLPFTFPIALPIIFRQD